MFKKINRSKINKWFTIVSGITYGFLFAITLISGIFALIVLVNDSKNYVHFDSFLDISVTKGDAFITDHSVEITDIIDNKMYYTFTAKINPEYDMNIVLYQYDTKKANADLISIKVNEDMYYEYGNSFVIPAETETYIEVKGVVENVINKRGYRKIDSRIHGIHYVFSLDGQATTITLNPTLVGTYTYDEYNNVLNTKDSKYSSKPYVIANSIIEILVNIFNGMTIYYIPFFCIIEFVLGIGTIIDIKKERKKEEKQKEQVEMDELKEK